VKIIVFAPTNVKIDKTSDQTKPLGGADQQLIRLYHTLQAEHQVNFYVNTDKKEHDWHPYMEIFEQPQECDLLILYRKAWVLPHNIKHKKALFYSQDTNETACFVGLKHNESTFFEQFDQIICLSNYHKNNLLEKFDIKENQVEIIGNSTEHLGNIPKKRNEFIYISTPYRGLQILTKMWKEHYKEFPDYQLKIYSSMSIYNGENLDQTTFKNAYEKIKNLPNCTYSPAIPRPKLIQEIKRAKLLLYPNTYPETFCNAINDSMACKTPFITTCKGCLKETGKNAGFYIQGDPYTETYQKQFIEATKLALNKIILMQYRCKKYRNNDHYKADIQKLLLKMEGKL